MRNKQGRFIKRPQQINNLTESMCGYIAGILDGEGFFQIWYHKKDNSYHPRLRVRMTDKKTIKYLKEKTNIGLVYTIIPLGNRKTIYEWVICNRDEIKNLLEFVTHYLITKHKTALLLLEAINLKDKNIHRGDKIIQLRKGIQKLGRGYNCGVRKTSR